ncbi:MAG: formylglycine-generating enzyme family protein, partial [Planctomycetaceae bacterium]
VQEWCQDWWDEKYYGKSAAADPAGPASGSSRVVRGRSWRSKSAHLRSALRDYVTPRYRDPDIGLRVLCELE